MSAERVRIDAEFERADGRLRRMAKAQGLQLQRARTRTPEDVDYNTYRLVDPTTRAVVASSGFSHYGLTMDDVERYLSERVA